MSVRAPSELDAIARAEAERLVTDLLAVPVTVEPALGDASWQPTRRRWVHRQSFAITRRFDAVEVVVDAAGRILRFADENRLAAPVRGEELAPDALLELARTSGLLGASARIEATLAGALPTIVVAQDEAPRRTRFVLHPTLCLLAAFDVLEDVAP